MFYFQWTILTFFLSLINFTFWHNSLSDPQFNAIAEQPWANILKDTAWSFGIGIVILVFTIEFLKSRSKVQY